TVNRHYATITVRQEPEMLTGRGRFGIMAGREELNMAATTTATYHCPGCGRNWDADRTRWRCECGSHFNLAPGRGLARSDIAANEASLWRYTAALALRRPPRISLGEGWTPLVARDWRGAKVHFKLESQMPTGSFKD